MYAKFRTVSSALVVAEFTLPLLAILGLSRVLSDPEGVWKERRNRIGAGVSLALTAGVCFLFALAPSLANLMSAQDLQMFDQMQNLGMPADFLTGYRSAIATMHAAILSATAWRSFALIAVAAAPNCCRLGA